MSKVKVARSVCATRPELSVVSLVKIAIDGGMTVCHGAVCDVQGKSVAGGLSSVVSLSGLVPWTADADPNAAENVQLCPSTTGQASDLLCYHRMP